MMDMLKQWIINLCGLVILVTAVEMILPDNSLKKYAKYVLGLIIVLIMMTPFLKIYKKNFNVETYISNSEDNIQKEVYKKEVKIKIKDREDKTIELFKENLEKQCINVLSNTYKKDKFHINIEVVKKENILYVVKINVGLSYGGVKAVRPITLGKSHKVQYEPLKNKEVEKKIKDLIFNYLGIDKDKINVYSFE